MNKFYPVPAKLMPGLRVATRFAESSIILLLLLLLTTAPASAACLDQTLTPTTGAPFCTSTGVTIGLASSENNHTYQLRRTVGASTVNVGAAVAGNGVAISFGLQTVAGTYTVFYQRTNGNNCSGVMTGSIVINPSPALFTVTGTTPFCEGTSTAIGLSDSETGVNYALVRGATTVQTIAGTGNALSFTAQSTAGTYTVTATPTSGNCARTMTGSIVGNANPTAFSVTGGGAYCTGGTGQPVNLSDSESGVSYQLYLDAVADGAPVAGTGSALAFGNKTTAGTYTVIATSNGCSTAQTGSAVVSVVALPIIYNVTGPANFCAGTSTVIGLSNSQSNVNYELLRNGSVVGSPVAGTTGSAISFPAQTLAGTYTVRATTASASCQQTMSGSVIGNNAPTAFTISGGGAYCSGGTGLAVNLSGSESGVSYQLLLNGVASGSPVSGTGSAISFGNQTAAGTYTATGTVGACTTTMSSSAVVTVNASPTAFTVTGPATFCPPTATTIGLNGSEVGVNYELLRDGVLVVTKAGTGAAFTFSPSQTVAGLYTVRATRTSGGCQRVMNGSVNGVSITTYIVTGGGAYCTGGTGVPIGLTNSQVGINYQLYLGASAVGTPVAGTGFALSLGDQTVAGTYTVRGVSGTCSKLMSGSATIFTSPAPNVYTVGGGGVYCEGGIGLDVNLDFSDSDTDYQLYLDGSPIGASFTGVDGPLSFGNQTAVGTYTVEGNNGGCQLFMDGSVDISTIPSPTAYNVTGGGSFCPGGTGVAVGLSDTDPGVTYQLYVDGNPVGTAMNGTGAAISFGNKTTLGTYTVTATLTSNSCPRDMNGSVVVSNYPAPTAFNITGGGSYCIGGTGSPIGLSGSEVGVNYQLLRGATTVGAAVAGTGAALSFGNQTTAGTYTVRATRVSTTCQSTMTGSTTVSTVTPPLTVNTLSSNSPVCDNNVQVTLLTSQNGYSYQLRLNATNTAVGSPVVGTGGSITLTGLPITANTVFNVLVTSPAPSVCTSQLTSTITVVKNCAPIANSDYNLVPMSTATDGNVIINDTDPEFGVLTVSLATLPAHGTVTMNASGGYVYTPTANYLGSDFFTYKICDNGTPSRCATTTVELLVYDPSTACSLPTGPNLLVNPDFTLGNTGFQTNYTYVAPGYTGATGNLVAEGVYTVDDQAGDSHPSFLQAGYGGSGNFLIINGINTIKTLYKQTIAVQPNTYYNFSAQFNNILKTTINAPDPEFGFVINNQSTSGTLVVPESPDSWITYSDIWYSGSSTSAVFEIRNVSIDLNGNDMGIDHMYFGTCNVAPVAVNVTHSPAIPNTAGQVLLDSLKGYDPDGSVSFFRIRTLPDPAHGILYLNGIPAQLSQNLTPAEAGELYFDPVAGYVGNATFQFRVFDNANAASSNIGVYTIPISTDNPAVYVVAPAKAVTAYTNGFSLATVSDPDGAITSAVLASGTLPAGVALNATTGQITVSNRTLLVAGSYTFQIRTIDAAGGVTTQLVTLVFNTNSPSVYSSPNNYNKDVLTNGFTLATVTDPDAAITSAAFAAGSSLPAWMSLNSSTGTITVSNAAAAVAGTYSATINTVDAGGGATAAPVSITIYNDIEAVYTVAASQNIDTYTAGQNLASVTDGNGAITNAVLTSGTLPAGFALNAVTGQVTVATPSSLVAGTYVLNIKTTDATGGTTTQPVSIIIGQDQEAVYTVLPATHFYFLTDGQTLASVTDADGAITSITLLSGAVPAGTSLNLSTGTITVTNASALVAGSSPLQIRTVDATGGITVQTITIIISDDLDVDAVPDSVDIDDNNDGISDLIADGGYEPFEDDDNDGTRNYRDMDFGPAGNADGGRISLISQAESNGRGGSGPNTLSDTNNDGINDVFDFDRDGIINSFDLDMDSDGISNVLEANAGTSPANYDAAQADISGPVGTNGMPDAAETAPESGITILPLVNTDLDFKPDYVDRDSDNDGIRDAIEAQVALGFRAASGQDSDKDGLDNIHDGSCGCAVAGLPISPVDTDTDGFHDYRDIDSDNDTKGDFSEGFDNNLNGYAVDDLRDRASIFEAMAGSPGWYTTLNSNSSGFEDWLEDDDADGVLNYLDPNSTSYHDTDHDGIIDLFDVTTFGASANPPDANGNGMPDYRDGGNIVPLPVQWLSFEATANGHVSELFWQTASEKENEKFVVERSVDGKHFSEIGEVAGNGTTAQSSTYHFTDKAPVTGSNYYRLKQVDLSGKSSYSIIRSVRFERAEAAMNLYPNPALSYVQLQLAGTDAQQVEVYSLDGGLVLSERLVNQQAVLDVSQLAAGSYVVKVQTQHQLLVKQLLKQ